ncbi:MAG: inorganic pyrophosphatase [Pyrinomonadaceae bacterium]
MSEKMGDRPAKSLLQAHPWHGISPGQNAPESVNAFIEIVPTDVVKYELDKASGHLKIDRPQRFSSLCPAPYGFIPQTLCGDEVGLLCGARAGLDQVKGDGDPMDICVLTEKSLAHGNFLMTARPIGGLLMIDGNEADDKIIAVLESDLAYGQFQDISDCPQTLIDRLRHYFLSYKQLPQDAPRRVDIVEVYNREAAMEVINTSLRDYQNQYGTTLLDRAGGVRRNAR